MSVFQVGIDVGTHSDDDDGYRLNLYICCYSRKHDEKLIKLKLPEKRCHAASFVIVVTLASFAIKGMNQDVDEAKARDQRDGITPYDDNDTPKSAALHSFKERYFSSVSIPRKWFVVVPVIVVVVVLPVVIVVVGNSTGSSIVLLRFTSSTMRFADRIFSRVIARGTIGRDVKTWRRICIYTDAARVDRNREGEGEGEEEEEIEEKEEKEEEE
uniref:Transmembrane protein n=1 Tax=Vespula pensylvanica TaxID=30213 RepID=A0A834NBF6_VESPE|nr:hypothetical protein H0235_015325 [Vespula pensylvanica]